MTLALTLVGAIAAILAIALIANEYWPEIIEALDLRRLS
jgi:hypothetical protein